MIEAQNLCKHYPGVKAVNGVSFHIPRGVCFGLLGPNGAGKTTTVEMLEGIITPSSGNILYKGEPLGQRFRNEAGIMFQHTALQEFIQVDEALRMFQNFYPNPRPLDDLVEACALEEFLTRDTRKLSGGQKQRLLLAIALINNPEVVFLDEPTTGLDPQSRRNLWSQVRRIKAENKTLVLTTHYMEEAFELCDEIIIMDHGVIIAQGNPKALLADHFDNSVITLPRDALPDQLTLNDGASIHPQGDIVEILSKDVDSTIRLLTANQIPLRQLQVRTPTLEDLFLELTGHHLRS
ncbi:MAG: ABC transporter ATP-binding protein [Candidatus Thiodiazotropha lotti]|uniref:ABC transporter ATP-binding protein n=1 Tax=Candidatus Thiodiazotropha lotti TaxID=2792787 RepID=A0A9E4K346_9GAMM|nr:ABC transporter ATP-binding protein [Candidatus Thiodiazotropha lotti]ODB93060.1 ABC transporter ATP-binding protein [Candidatus Thiodiazotropha endoloripes]MCG7922466.1 ABC transporter ATP-binding protein [Candidatus Thiodiazotropha lotti]MCG7929308.1 ABC transporter ATP-binding protein [Candidatus Thiodiazotropha lotti]MCG7937904.1 ABC transporter ATP-binding protein [Candidatus Thiodiazotropha lotti]